MMCAKIKRREFDKIKSKLNADNNFSFIFENDYILIPIRSADKSIEVVECNPQPKSKTPRLHDIVDNASSYYVIGDIALVNVKNQKIDFKQLSAAILSINKNVKSVFLRKKVKGELRINDIEFLGGEYKTKTIYKENGLKFVVDISKVYVNPSLANERLNIRKEVNHNGKILDAFAGYGAISLNLAKKDIYIIAGDLNIDGLLLLKESLQINKIYNIDIINYDARFLPFRDKAFSRVYGDNPTMIKDFIQELCRVTKEILEIYILSNENELTRLNAFKWIKINDYSKNLFIFKGYIRCNNTN